MDNSRVYTISELNYLLENLAPIKETLDYIDYASKPHLQKGSSGAICPYLPKAIALDSIWCSVSKLQEYSFREMEELIHDNVELFYSLSSNEKINKTFQSLVLVFPNIPYEQVGKLITGIHSTFKRRLVYKGLMIGEFFSENSHHGLYNKEFYPLRSNIPLIAIRNLIPEDLPFLNKESDSIEMRIDFLQGYLQTFEGKLDSIRYTTVKEKLEELKEKLYI
ncbi:DUF6875 domain-containing protein [Lysinibacillus sp. NPDC059133]|uniref:DUF6875 domain-containing protein n=1 Tax=Lysinibacillus sp. NPDC059133 TaxID=3346737 RepID=UPI0036BD0B3D